MSGSGGPRYYEIRVVEVLDGRWAVWFEGLQVASEGSETVRGNPLEQFKLLEHPDLVGSGGTTIVWPVETEADRRATRPMTTRVR